MSGLLNPQQELSLVRAQLQIVQEHIERKEQLLTSTLLGVEEYHTAFGALQALKDVSEKMNAQYKSMVNR